MYKIFHYLKPFPVYVKFQRLFMGWLAIITLFAQDINLLRLFFLLSFLGLVTGTQRSIITFFYKIFKTLFSLDLVRITSHHIRYYEINNSMDLIDHILRLIASSVALLLLYLHLETSAWIIVAFLSVFMMLSAYFGFCLSALTYIGLRKIFVGRKALQHEDTKESFNQRCTLARHCFKPYQRCDSCHININECLGTKFNLLVLVIGLAMSLFLFIDNYYFIYINIVVIMGLFFWFGYQINYNTDALAESNDKNLKLNEQLRTYNKSLQIEVQRRTAEIEHLVSHDQLTNIYNRYYIEKKATQALEETHQNEKLYVLACLDLDHFKRVNDTSGHLAGDELLKQITALMQSHLNEQSILARLGGDEFGLLCRDKTVEEVEKLCQIICKDIAAFDFIWEDKHFTVGASIGVVQLTKKIATMTQLFHLADMACYKIKKEGKNGVAIASL